MYLIDTDYLIYLLKGKPQAIKILSGINESDLGTSVICVAEVLEGLLDKRNSRRMKIFKEMIQVLTVIPVDEKVAKVFAKTRKDLRRQGKLIDNFDLLIASTCLAYNLELITGNKNHFRRIKNLKIYPKGKT